MNFQTFNNVTESEVFLIEPLSTAHQRYTIVYKRKLPRKISFSLKFVNFKIIYYF